MTSLAIVILVMAFVAMRRARRCRHYYGYGWCGPFGDGWHGHHGWHSRRHRRARMMLHGLFMRIDASPAQERAIIAEIEQLQERLHGIKTGLRDARGDLAAALRGIHGVLDDRQRSQVADLLDQRGGWWHGFGPYR